MSSPYMIRRKLTKRGAVRFYRVRGRNAMSCKLTWVLMPKVVAELALQTGEGELVATELDPATGYPVAADGEVQA
jgi:hypothetical protein